MSIIAVCRCEFCEAFRKQDMPPPRPSAWQPKTVEEFIKRFDEDAIANLSANPKGSDDEA